MRLLLDLAEHKNDGFIALKTIAERQGISKKYLEQLIPLLNQPDILRTTRGYKGGYMLAKSPDQYTVGQILKITEKSLCPVSCLEDDPNKCERVSQCKTLPMWKGLKQVIDDYLGSITLKMLLDGDFKADGLF